MHKMHTLCMAEGNIVGEVGTSAILTSIALCSLCCRLSFMATGLRLQLLFSLHVQRISRHLSALLGALAFSMSSFRNIITFFLQLL